MTVAPDSPTVVRVRSNWLGPCGRWANGRGRRFWANGRGRLWARVVLRFVSAREWREEDGSGRSSLLSTLCTDLGLPWEQLFTFREHSGGGRSTACSPPERRPRVSNPDFSAGWVI